MLNADLCKATFSSALSIVSLEFMRIAVSQLLITLPTLALSEHNLDNIFFLTRTIFVSEHWPTKLHLILRDKTDKAFQIGDITIKSERSHHYTRAGNILKKSELNGSSVICRKSILLLLFSRRMHVSFLCITFVRANTTLDTHSRDIEACSNLRNRVDL